MENDINMEITGYKLTDKDGLPFYTKKTKYKLEVGKTIEADDFISSKECGHGIHFCRDICITVPYGIIAATFDRRYAKLNDGYPDKYAFAKDGFKVFEIKATDTQKLDGGKFKARKIKVVREVPLEECVKEALNANYATDTLSLLAASPFLPPGCMELLKKVRCHFVQGALLMNPKNPDHLRVGDNVRLSQFYPRQDYTHECKFFNHNPQAVVKEINQRDGYITVKGNSGDIDKIWVEYLEKIPTEHKTVEYKTMEVPKWSLPPSSSFTKMFRQNS